MNKKYIFTAANAAKGEMAESYNGEELWEDVFGIVLDEDDAEDDDDEPRRVTCQYWQGIPAGETVETGFLAGVTELTAPAEEGTYTLYEVADSSNCHLGFEWVKD